LARLREDDRLALLRLADLRLRDRDDDLRALFRAELRRPFLADLALRLAERRALFLAPLRAAFFRPRVADDLVAFLRDLVPERDLERPVERPPMPVSLRRLGEGSSKSKEDGVDEGEGEGVLSEGKGSIHPEPDQPISI
jgi:hypothetical protein